MWKKVPERRHIQGKKRVMKQIEGKNGKMKEDIRH